MVYHEGMTESAYEKQIAELVKEMNAERKKIEEDDVPSLNNLIDRSLTLRATLQDIRANHEGSTPQSAYDLQQIRTSREVLAEYARGRSDDISVPVSDIKQDGARAIATLLADHPPYNIGVYLPMIRLALGTTPAAYQSARTLMRDLQNAQVSSRECAFLWGEIIRAGACERLYDDIRKFLTPSLNISYGNSPADLWR